MFADEIGDVGEALSEELENVEDALAADCLLRAERKGDERGKFKLGRR